MIMDFCKRYEPVQVTAEDAVFYLLKRSLAEMPRAMNISRPSQPGERGVATFVSSGTRWTVPMREAVRAICDAGPYAHHTLKALAAHAGKRVPDFEAEYRSTLQLIDEELAAPPESMEIVRGLSVLRGAIATCLTVSSLCMAA